MESNAAGIGAIIMFVGVIVVLSGAREVANYEDGSPWWGMAGIATGVVLAVVGLFLFQGRLG